MKPSEVQKRVTNRWDNLRGLLEDAGLLLQPAHVLDDLIDVFGCGRVDFRHVAEFPVMGLHSAGSRSLKGGIAMMIGFVNFMHERGTLACADTTRAMAG